MQTAELSFLVVVQFLLLDIALSLSSSNLTSESTTAGSTYISMHRMLSGLGFHRNIHTTFSIEKSFLEHAASDKKCQLLLKETLPSGIYADPFQLKQMEPFGGPRVLFDRSVDIEAAEYLSKPHELFVYVGPLISETIVIRLPIHGRYHRLSEDKTSTHSELKILHPRLYSTCSFTDEKNTIDAPCNVENTSVCNWNYVPYNTKSPVLKLQIPHGQSKDKPIVVVVTLMVTVGVCAILVKKLFTVKYVDHIKHT